VCCCYCYEDPQHDLADPLLHFVSSLTLSSLLMVVIVILIVMVVGVVHKLDQASS
jgi:hypothetical protein